jgi:hypothetical protein
MALPVLFEWHAAAGSRFAALALETAESQRRHTNEDFHFSDIDYTFSAR